MSQNIIQKFIDMIFKPRVITLASTTVKLIPLNKKGENEKIRKMVIDYLINKHGQKKTEEIINCSDWGVDKFIPSDNYKENNSISDCFCIDIKSKDEKYSYSFWFDGEKLEESGDAVDENSDIGKILHNSK